MVECGCVIIHTSTGVSVQLCGAHSYGTDMLPLLRRFLQIFGELEARYGPSLTAAYHDTLHEAHALLRKVDDSREEQRGGTDSQALADTQKVIDAPMRPTRESRRERGRAYKLD